MQIKFRDLLLNVTFDMLRILKLPFAHNHNSLSLVRKSDCKPLQCNFLLIRELPRSFASGSLAAAAIN